MTRVTFQGFLAALAVCGWVAASAHAVTDLGIGVLGDSYSEEYDDISARNDHRNWVEQLGNSNGLDDNITGGPYNFGAYRQGFPFPTTPTTWDSQRNQGFEYNWAQSGETTNGVLSDQLSGLNSQVASDAVNIVMIFAGVNDFGNFSMNQTQLDAEVADVVANINTMINTLRATDPTLKIVLSNIHDRSIWPSVTGNESISAQQRQDVSNAIQSANSQIVSNAHLLDIPVIDAFALLNDFALAPAGGKTFAGVTVRNDITVLGDTDEPADSLWADASHAGTVWQGIFANTFLTALDIAYGGAFGVGDLVLLDNQTIWDNAYAGFAGSPPTATSDVFNYADYVLFPTLPALIGDYDGNGLVGQGDLALVLAYWGVAAADGQSPDPLNWINADDVTASLIGQDELALVLQNWGNTAEILAALPTISSITGLTESQITALIPEPASVLLLAAGALAVMGRRQSRSCW